MACGTPLIHMILNGGGGGGGGATKKMGVMAPVLPVPLTATLLHRHCTIALCHSMDSQSCQHSTYAFDIIKLIATL